MHPHRGFSHYDTMAKNGADQWSDNGDFTHLRPCRQTPRYRESAKGGCAVESHALHWAWRSRACVCSSGTFEAPRIDNKLFSLYIRIHIYRLKKKGSSTNTKMTVRGLQIITKD